LGAFCGSVLALSVAKSSWFTQLKSWHEQWIKHNRLSDVALAILAAWIFAQVNPSLPMLGSVFVSAIARWPFDIVQASPFNWFESGAVALNLLLLGMLMLTLLRERRHTLSALLLVLGMVTLIKFFVAVLLLKSWAIFLWLNSEAIFGVVAGLLLVTGAIRLSERWMLLAVVLAGVCYLLLVLQLAWFAPPSAVMRLYQWRYFNLLNYNGLSQLINLLFPLLLVAYLWRTGTLRKE
jgi:hypothetical protein